MTNDELQSLIERLPTFSFDQIAALNIEVFCEGQRRQGWKRPKETVQLFNEEDELQSILQRLPDLSDGQLDELDREAGYEMGLRETWAEMDEEEEAA